MAAITLYWILVYADGIGKSEELSPPTTKEVCEQMLVDARDNSFKAFHRYYRCVPTPVRHRKRG